MEFAREEWLGNYTAYDFEDVKKGQTWWLKEYHNSETRHEIKIQSVNPPVWTDTRQNQWVQRDFVYAFDYRNKLFIQGTAVEDPDEMVIEDVNDRLFSEIIAEVDGYELSHYAQKDFGNIDGVAWSAQMNDAKDGETWWLRVFEDDANVPIRVMVKVLAVGDDYWHTEQGAIRLNDFVYAFQYGRQLYVQGVPNPNRLITINEFKTRYGKMGENDPKTGLPRWEFGVYDDRSEDSRIQAKEYGDRYISKYKNIFEETIPSQVGVTVETDKLSNAQITFLVLGAAVVLYFTSDL